MTTQIQASAELPTLLKYRRHLEGTAKWLKRSIAHGRGGSCAHYSPMMGWSRPYPETTGYLVPTLLRLDPCLPQLNLAEDAVRLGNWLLKIQRPEGAWNGGLHPPGGSGAPSVFNTGQILKGMVALHARTGESKWFEAAQRGAKWLSQEQRPDGLWPAGDYRAGETPSYYTHVIWPMLEVWKVGGDEALRRGGQRALDTIIGRLAANGVVRGWGFREGGPAVTHTIAYTLRGIQESARLLEARDRYVPAVRPALEVLIRRSELAGGALPGAFDDNWRAVGKYVCLTGNAQVAICVLLEEAVTPDLRLVSAAARMIDFVCSTQSLASPLPGLRGAVAGSTPVWANYMRMRYPNWAAKYHCDAILALTTRIEAELS